MSKGSAPRNCFSQKFKENYDAINWSEQKKCSICGLILKDDNLKKYKELYNFYENGEITHKTCNLNS